MFSYLSCILPLLSGTTPAGYQEDYGGGATDAFLAKFTGATGAVQWGTWIGGLEADEGKDIAVDKAGTSGSPYLTGWTNSRNFPLSYGAFQTNRLGNDAFVVKMNPTGTTLGKRQKEPVAEQRTSEPDKGIGVTGESKGLSVVVYPNPTTTETTVGFVMPETGLVSVSIYTMSGKQIKMIEESVVSNMQYQWRFGTAEIPSGQYLVEVRIGSYRGTALLTVTH